MTLSTPTLLLRSLCVLTLGLFVLSCDDNKVEAIKTFTVNFDTDGGSIVESLVITKDTKANKPTSPKREGYAFGGWCTDKAATLAYDFATPVAADVILYAKWFPFAKSLEGLSSLPSPTVPDDLYAYPKLIQDILKPYAAGTAMAFKFLKVTAAGTEDATSWENAGADLEATIDGFMDAAANKVHVVLLAEGIYVPSATLSMKNNVAIVGGFSATTNWARTTSDITILDGNRDKQVFSNTNIDSTALLYGVTIARGRIAGDGGGMYNARSSPTLINVVFSGNSATARGGGMYNKQSSPTLTNVTFAENSANARGGGMYNYYSPSMVLTNVIFSGNTAVDGGGMCNSNFSSITLTNVAFSGNSADDGGGMYNYYSSSITLTNVTFSGNSADDDGGGMYNSNASPKLMNVTFSENVANARGGGMYNTNFSPNLTNVTFSNNRANKGGGMYNSPGSLSILTNVTFFKNRANGSGGSGGGMYNDQSSPTLIGFTSVENGASLYGGGMYNGNGSSPVIVNGILWGDLAQASGNMMYQSGSRAHIYGGIVDCRRQGFRNVDGGSTSVEVTCIRTSPFTNGTLADNGGDVQTIAIARGGSAHNRGWYVRRSGSGPNVIFYYSTNKSAWFTSYTLTGATVTPPADAIELTATDATGYTRVGKPDAGAHEAR